MNVVETVISTVFSLTAMEKLSGATQGRWGCFIIKMLCSLHLFFSWGQLRGRKGAVSSEMLYPVHLFSFELLWVS